MPAAPTAVARKQLIAPLIIQAKILVATAQLTALARRFLDQAAAAASIRVRPTIGIIVGKSP
jgi:hypothetical protein